jgi:GTP cyclohydrolase II
MSYLQIFNSQLLIFNSQFMIVKLAETPLKTQFGDYLKILFYDGQKESIALVMGDVVRKENVLCRVHSACMSAHAFNSIECDCREQMAMAQQLIQQNGQGIIIWLEQEGKGNGHFALMQSMAYKKNGLSQAEAYEAVNFKRDARDFRAAADILKALDVASIVLLTDNSLKINDLVAQGIQVVGTKEIKI